MQWHVKLCCGLPQFLAFSRDLAFGAGDAAANAVLPGCLAGDVLILRDLQSFLTGEFPSHSVTQSLLSRLEDSAFASSCRLILSVSATLFSSLH